MELRLDGMAAIVTGGGGGLGAAYGRALAESGAGVALADVNLPAANAAAEKLVADGLDAMAVPLDVTSEESAAAAARATADRFGGIDILVNNAALMAEIPQTGLMDLDTAMWKRVLDVNLTGPYLCAKAVVPYLKERGRGKIVNQTSGGAFQPAGSYGVSKLGLVSLTASLARELAPHQINVNSIAPGYVDTEAGQRATPDEMKPLLDHMVPLKGLGDTDDVVGLLVFLCSSKSDWMTGQTISVDGGWVMRL